MALRAQGSGKASFDSCAANSIPGIPWGILCSSKSSDPLNLCQFGQHCQSVFTSRSSAYWKANQSVYKELGQTRATGPWMPQELPLAALDATDTVSEEELRTESILFP